MSAACALRGRRAEEIDAAQRWQPSSLRLPRRARSAWACEMLSSQVACQCRKDGFSGLVIDASADGKAGIDVVVVASGNAGLARSNGRTSRGSWSIGCAGFTGEAWRRRTAGTRRASSNSRFARNRRDSSRGPRSTGAPRYRCVAGGAISSVARNRGPGKSRLAARTGCEMQANKAE
jgi:hypothetical protein